MSYLRDGTKALFRPITLSPSPNPPLQGHWQVNVRGTDHLHNETSGTEGKPRNQDAATPKAARASLGDPEVELSQGVLQSHSSCLQWGFWASQSV